MFLNKLIKTISFLRPIQVFKQILVRIYTPKFKKFNCRLFNKLDIILFLKKKPVYNQGVFCFINIYDSFMNWNDTSNGLLWVYNLNYMDWILQSGHTFEDGVIWIDKFIEDLYENQIGLDAYPIALRGVNWIKFISLYYDEIPQKKIETWNNSLYSQYKLLEKKIEYHLLANHLLEDAYSLFIASLYFNNKSFYKKSKKILVSELNEQILPDGAHFEQSPMYHCILLDRLLDCYNFSINNVLFDSQFKLNSFIRSKAIQMLGHLESIIYIDGSFPLFNDSAEGVAPIPKDIFSYAKRLGLIWKPLKLKECGYRKMKSTNMEAFVDIGNITASYQPGHTHSDVLNYELRIKGRPFIVDTGVSTYDNTARRIYERSSCAHNTLTIRGYNAYDVWGSFRVGKRAYVNVLKDAPDEIVVTHDGYKKTDKVFVMRHYMMLQDKFIINDSSSKSSECISYIHFAPDVEIQDVSKNTVNTNIGLIIIKGANKVLLLDDFVSKKYNKLESTKVLKIYFHLKMKVIVTY